MQKPKNIRREILEWALLISVPVMLYVTGLHTEALGGVQRIFLSTGLIKPAKIAKNEEIPANYDLQLVTLEGKPVSLKELKGKVIFLNLWATWCPPCIAEMPDIHNLYQQMDSSKIAFVMISLDEDVNKPRKYIKKKKFTFPVYQVSGEMPEVYTTRSIPTTYIISASGKIVSRREGIDSYNTPEFVRFLNALTKK